MATARANLETTISADMSQYAATMRRAGMVAQQTAGRVAKSFGSGLTRTIATAGAALVAAFGARAFASGIKGAADLGGTLSDLSARTGIAAGDLALLRRAFEDNGVSADKIGGVINKLQKTIFDAANGSEKAAKPFAALGISIEEISKLNPAQQFELIQKRLSGIESPAARAAIAMQIFGKSGGELLTLFADGGAMAKAGQFLGSQAEILNRRAATFDEISDILARAGEKLQGFFVGVLDSVADPLLEILQKFDSLDLAKMGQDAGKFILEAVDMTGQMLDMAFQFGQRLTNGIEAAGVLLRAAFSPDFWLAQGKLVVAAMGDGVNTLYAGVNAVGAMLMQVFAEMPNLVWNAWKFLTDPSFWESVKNGLLNVAANFAMSLVGFLSKAFELLKNMDFQGLKDLGKNIADEISGNKTGGYDFKVGDSVKDSMDRILKAGKDAFNGTDAIFDTSGLKNDAKGVFAEIGKEWKEILNRPVEKLPDAIKKFIKKYKPAFDDATGQGKKETDGVSEMQKKASEYASAGFKGLSGLYQMQADKESGIGPGESGAFASDRKRLGLVSGLQTGSLGEKRRLATSKDQRDAKKALSAQEAQLDKLSSIDTNIKQALTVS